MSAVANAFFDNRQSDDMFFDFATEINNQIAAGHIEVTSWPAVMGKISKLLSNEHLPIHQVTPVVAAEPELSKRLLSIASSAFMGGRVVSELGAAISRLGYKNVRATTMAFALSKLRQAKELGSIRSHLDELWGDATLVAVLAYAIAKEVRVINADEALSAGLMHNIGKFHILSEAQAYPQLFVNDGVLTSLMNRLHPRVGRVVIEAWDFPDEIAQAVQDQQKLDRVVPYPDLTDVVSAAVLLSKYLDQTCHLKKTEGELEKTESEHFEFESDIEGCGVLSRLGLTGEKFERLVLIHSEEMAQLRSILR